MISELLKSIEKEYPLVIQSDAFRELKQRFNKERAVYPSTSHYDEILFHVRDYFGLSRDEILMGRRKRRVALPRQVAMFLMAEESIKYANGSTPKWSEIGRYFGKDHATIIHAHRQIGGFLEYDQELQRVVSLIKQRLFVG